MFNKIFIFLLGFGLSACSKLDDYMLGQDNTPKPSDLKPITAAGSDSLKEKWTVSIGSSKKNANYLKLKPVLIGSTVYTADASGSIQARKNNSGEALWVKNLSSGIISGPTIANSKIILTTDNSKIIALSKDTGKELWQATLSSDALAKPIIAKNLVIAKTIDGNLYAFELDSGKQRWISEHGAPSLILKASSSPVLVSNKMVLVGYSDGKMDAVDIDSGQLIWQRSIAYANGSSDVERLVDIDADPLVEGDTILLASYQGYVGALSISSGQFIWRKPASTYKNIVANSDTLFMTDSDDVIWSINKKTGQVNWKQVNLKARGLTEPVLQGKNLVLGDKAGVLHIISAKSGDFISRQNVGGSIQIAPTVKGSNVFIMTSNGKLSRFSVG